jgi:hypothetical protein
MSSKEKELLAQRGLVSCEEIESLRQHFERNRPNKIRKKKRKAKAPVGSRKVTNLMARKFYEMKFNAGFTYGKIARITSFHGSTIHAALKRFIARGMRVTDLRRNNGKKFNLRRKLTDDAK